MSTEAVREALTAARPRRALRGARASRAAPARDEKVLASWNGRAIRVRHRRASPRRAVRRHRERRALVLPRAPVRRGDLARRWLDGDVRGPGYLDDHAFLARGALDVYSVTGDPEALGFALDLAATVVSDFYDEADGTIYFTRDRTETPVTAATIPSSPGRRSSPTSRPRRASAWRRRRSRSSTASGPTASSPRSQRRS